MTTPHNPDDKLFRVIASRPELVKEMLEKWAPPLVLARLDLRTLHLSDSSFVDESLAEHFADIVYTCQTLGGGMAHIPLILEHKSYVPANPPLQVMRYQMLAWAKQETTKGSMLTPVLPVIFYHGAEKWEVKPWGSYLHGMDPAFEPYTPSGGYIFIDLSGITDDDIKDFRSGFLITAMLLMKHRMEREFLLKNLLDIVIFVSQDAVVDREALNYNLKTVLRYLQGIQALAWDEVKKIIRPMQNMEKFFWDVDAEIREEAKQEGLLMGMQQGMQQGKQQGIALGEKSVILSLLENFPNYSDEQLAKITSKPLEFIRQLRLEAKKTPPKRTRNGGKKPPKQKG